MNTWYKKFFRRLVNATVFNSLVTYKENTGQCVYFKIWVTLDWGFVGTILIAEWSIRSPRWWHGCKETEHNAIFPEEYFVQKINVNEKNLKPAPSMTNEERLLVSCLWCRYVHQCVFRDQHMKKNYGGNLRCIFIIYSLLKITISSLDSIQQTYGNYFGSDVSNL
jgi:hypothetical protein